MEEVRLSVMDALRILQRYLSGVKSRTTAETKYKTIMRYVSQLSSDLGELTELKSADIEDSLKSLIEKKYSKLFGQDDEPEAEEAKGVKEEAEEEA